MRAGTEMFQLLLSGLTVLRLRGHYRSLTRVCIAQKYENFQVPENEGETKTDEFVQTKTTFCLSKVLAGSSGISAVRELF